ncbi:GNAT family N-acetyltransferase [Streptomyces sp. NPDC051776]|uniref:GNAT family N-acetyltransferase n=1 Tax=Streptomyces sp. NPDC051776 TaxID=3155414 RepID=UPI00342B9694
MTPDLHTECLLLTPYTPADEAGFVALFQDTRVSRWMGDGPQSEADDRALFGRVFSRVYAQNLFDVWAVRLDGRLVGHAEIKPTEAVGGHEIVYALSPTVWGRGLGAEIARALVAYGFETLGVYAVHATVAEPNRTSLAILERTGFVRSRDIREDDGSRTLVLTLTRRAWAIKHRPADARRSHPIPPDAPDGRSRPSCPKYQDP